MIGRSVNKDQAFKTKANAMTFRCNPVDLRWLFDTINMAR